MNEKKYNIPFEQAPFAQFLVQLFFKNEEGMRVYINYGEPLCTAENDVEYNSPETAASAGWYTNAGTGVHIVAAAAYNQVQATCAAAPTQAVCVADASCSYTRYPSICWKGHKWLKVQHLPADAPTWH
jgi:hypothetical protein